MKAAIISFIVLTIVLTSVFLNSFFVSKSIEKITDRLKDAPETIDSYGLYSDIYDEYMKKQKFIGLTVSHDDLTNIEGEFNEILGSIRAKDKESLIIAKSRLVGALTHMKRLSGVNADSIF